MNIDHIPQPIGKILLRRGSERGIDPIYCIYRKPHPGGAVFLRCLCPAMFFEI